MRILILNGPNLNLLGQRERTLYGNQTLGELEQMLRRQGQALGVEIECYQSNVEGYLIDALQRSRNRCHGVVFNPGGYTHTSVALRDTIAAIDIPVIEVHMTNIHGREDFRRTSLTAGACVGQISGLGFLSYEMALGALARMIKAPAQTQTQPQQQAPPAVRPDRERVEGRPEAREGGQAAEGGDARDESGRDSKRRRRGRRGGRGRRRDGGAPLEEGTGASARDEDQRRNEPDLPDATERYANLKGVTVRRGLDVLAEENEEAPLPPKTGLVTFQDASKTETAHEPASTVRIAPPPRPEAPAAPPVPVQPAAAPEAAAETPEPRPRKSRPRKSSVVRKTAPRKRGSSAKQGTEEHADEDDD